jgi:hypothetical protein
VGLQKDKIERMLEKPKIGEPCNGCGLCCQLQVCRNGAYAMQLVNTLGETVAGPCKALVSRADGSFGCGIVMYPNKYIKGSKYPAKVLQKHFSVLIGAGSGCDELLENDTEEEAEKLDAIIANCMDDPEYVKKAKAALIIVHGI